MAKKKAGRRRAPRRRPPRRRSRPQEEAAGRRHVQLRLPQRAGSPSAGSLPATCSAKAFAERTMEVRLYPNSRRPGVGQRPRRESSRPLLPQHARHCPVLEAGSAAGFMVYPPLEPNESYHVEFQGEGRYQFTYFNLNPRREVGRRSSRSRIQPAGRHARDDQGRRDVPEREPVDVARGRAARRARLHRARGHGHAAGRAGAARRR